ncbi:MAG: helix-turn-helix transcriptional regulator [Oscillibacter sp.]|nr:helix-turn-helix transcriptional regulator [Oscillibacter sp.]
MTFYEKYRILCRDAGKSTSAVANAIGLNNSSVTCWKRGSQPKAETIRKLSEYFGVSVDYLIGLTDDPHKPPFKDEPFHVKAARNPILDFNENYRISEISVGGTGKIVVTYELGDDGSSGGVNVIEFQKLLNLIAKMTKKYNITVDELFGMVKLTDKTMSYAVRYLQITQETSDGTGGEKKTVIPDTDGEEDV